MSDWECSAVFVLHTHICKESMNIGNNLFIWTSYILKEVMEMNSSRMHAEAKIYEKNLREVHPSFIPRMLDNTTRIRILEVGDCLYASLHLSPSIASINQQFAEIIFQIRDIPR